jgi:hypothetical protein
MKMNLRRFMIIGCLVYMAVYFIAQYSNYIT